MNQRRWTWIGATVAAFALLLALVELPRTPLPWYDEILLVSAARSATLGHPAMPSVLDAFPHTMRSDLFYGPVVFWMGSTVLKVFGLSLWSWRLLGWFAGVAMVLESAWLVLRLGGSRGWAVFAALLVTLSPPVGSVLTSGRTDTITLAIELFVFCLLPPEFSLVKSVVAGFLFGAAILSTPRAHALALCFFTVYLSYAIVGKQTSLLRSVCLSAATALLTVVTWTFCEGLNPVSWYRMLLRASAGDKTNASPLLGGSWGHFTLDLPAMVLPVGLSSWLILWMIHRRKEPSLGSAGMLFTVLLANAAVYIAITSRALSYQIFWLVPLVPTVVALTAMHKRGHNPGWSSMVYVLAATVLVAGLLRVGKITEVIASWTARDPQPIANFVCNQVPQNSRVFGPTGPYYYAVEECGSHYLYAGKWTASGLQIFSRST